MRRRGKKKKSACIVFTKLFFLCFENLLCPVIGPCNMRGSLIACHCLIAITRTSLTDRGVRYWAGQMCQENHSRGLVVKTVISTNNRQSFPIVIKSRAKPEMGDLDFFSCKIMD